MTSVLILSPTQIANVGTSRGTGAANLLTADPKEVWRDPAPGTAVNIDIDLGVVRPIDTVFLGYVQPAAMEATWSISGGVADTGSLLKAPGPLRAVDAAVSALPSLSHAFWNGTAAMVRYLRLTVTAPASTSVTAGVVMVGKAFVPDLNMEWGSGRRPIDTGTVTPLPSGGFSIVEGARKRYFGWTLGDLTSAEVDQLDAIALDRGESAPVLVVEDPAPTTGQRNRIHYGLFERWRQFERRNKVQTKWELGIEEWV